MSKAQRAREVTVLDRQRRRRIAHLPLVRTVRDAATALRAPKGDVAIVLAGEDLLRRLNREYRGKDRPTDVLSFAQDGDAGETLGDIVISVPTAEGNARRAGHGLARELRLLVLHGVLHLLGHDHETDDGAMERLETRMRRRLGLVGRASR